MLRSSAFFVLYVFMIWGMILALTINDPVIPKISNIEIIPFLNGDIEKPPFHKQTAVNKGRTNSDIVYLNLIIKGPVFVINIYRRLNVSLIVDLKVELGLMEGIKERKPFSSLIGSSRFLNNFQLTGFKAGWACDGR